ncbi:MAG: hypothetical protein Fur0034_04590 [Desulfuromonadia bacterium]
MTPLLHASNLLVERGGVMVLSLDSFTIHPGEKIAVIGPNGSGKSTLLLSLTSILPRRGGTLRWRGEPVTPANELSFRRSIAMVFQEPLLFDTTVINNVIEGLRIRGVPRRDALRRGEESLELFRIGYLRDRNAHKLSVGEAKRVSLARAFAIRPAVIFLDEPFSSLDLPTRLAITEELGTILRLSNTAALIATHDRIEALTIVDRLAVISQGRVIQDGSPDVVCADPADDFAKAFFSVTL